MPQGRTPFEQIALLLQGGGALGAYQAGVYEALAEVDLHPDWVAGISIGAINSAIIAGNPPQRRVDALREFWRAVSASPFGIPFFRGVKYDDTQHELVNQARALGVLFFGAPNFFVPRMPPPAIWPPGSPDKASYYDNTPLRATLERLLDFDRINSGEMRFSVGAVDIRSGNFTYFDTTTHKIAFEHVAASGSLPPGFPATKIGDDYFWDGGLISNTPLEWVLNARPRRDTLAFQVDLWNARGELPKDMIEVEVRHKEIIYSSRNRAATDRYQYIQKLRIAFANLLKKMPEELRESADAKLLLAEADDKVCNIVHLIYRARPYEGIAKDFEFSRRTMEEHWLTGYRNARQTLANPEVLQLPDRLEGVRTFDIGEEWTDTRADEPAPSRTARDSSGWDREVSPPHSPHPPHPPRPPHPPHPPPPPPTTPEPPEVIPSLTERPPRYTDLQIFNQEGKPQEEHSLLAATQKYTLDVAIRVDRRGYGKNQGDQEPVNIKSQTETVSIWIVVTDETDSTTEAEDHDKLEGRLFTFNHRFTELRLPIVGDSEGSATFEFKADRDVLRSDSGIQPRIGVRLYHKLNLIDHVELDLRFEENTDVSSVTEDDLAIKVTFKHPGESSAIEAPDAESAARALNISISKISRGDEPDQDAYRFSFVIGNESGNPVLSGTKKLPESILNHYVAKFRDILLDTVFGASLTKVDLSVGDRDDLLKELSLLGTKIMTELFDYTKSKPTDLFRLGKMVHEALADRSSRILIIQISLSKGAEDFVFPWQVLTLDHYIDRDVRPVPENLWGYRFIIEVKRCGDGADRRAPAARAPSPLRVTYGRWNFANEPEHRQRLKEIISTATNPSQLAVPIVDSRQDFFAALKGGGGNLVYLFAHGHSATPSTPAGLRFRDKVRQQLEELAKEIQNNKLMSTTELEEKRRILEQFKKATSDGADSILTLTHSGVTLTGLLVEMPPGGRRLDDAPIVILNTCESAQVWNAVEGSFVGFFLDRGARAVLGCETTIPVVLADAFGRAVLEAMFRGNTLGEAVHKARSSLLKNQKNPLGLCYSIYGAADARLF